MSRSRLLLLAIGATSLLLLAAWSSAPVPRRDSVPTDALSRRKAEPLERIGALHTIPGDGGTPRYGLHAAAGPLPSTTSYRVEPGDERRIVCSIHAAPEDLRDPERGILTHPFERGGDWERPVFVSLFVRGELVAEAAARMRVSGGTTRAGAKSFRLTFVPGQEPGARGEPWADELPSTSTWVLRCDRKTALCAALAADLVNAAGGLALQGKPLAVDLDGERVHPLHFAFSRLDDTFAEQWTGHRDVLWARQKVDAGQRRPDRYRHLLRLAEGQRALDLETLERHLAVEPMLAWWIAVVLLEVDDANQGLAIFDRTTGERHWEWIPWDLDHALEAWDPRPRRGRTVLESFAHYGEDARLRLIQRAIGEDPQFRRLVQERVCETLNHPLCDAVVQPIFERYRRITETYYTGPRQREVLDQVEGYESYLAERPTRFFAELRDELDFPDPLRCRLDCAGVPDLCIDGHPFSGAEYRGWYYPGQELRLERASGGAFLVTGTAASTDARVHEWRVEVRAALELRVETADS